MYVRITICIYVWWLTINKLFYVTFSNKSLKTICKITESRDKNVMICQNMQLTDQVSIYKYSCPPLLSTNSSQDITTIVLQDWVRT